LRLGALVAKQKIDRDQLPNMLAYVFRHLDLPDALDQSHVFRKAMSRDSRRVAPNLFPPSNVHRDKQIMKFEAPASFVGCVGVLYFYK